MELGERGKKASLTVTIVLALAKATYFHGTLFISCDGNILSKVDCSSAESVHQIFSQRISCTIITTLVLFYDLSLYFHSCPSYLELYMGKGRIL